MTIGYQTKLVLCVTAQQLLAGVWRCGRLLGSQVFANNLSGHADFAALLQQYPAAPVYLMADAVEEDYRLEHLPHTRGAAKRELIARKLNQFYRGLEYRGAHFMHRDQALRKDDQFLFIALNNADFLHNWITAIHAAGVQLVGVYLLPMLSQVLLQQLKLTDPHMILCEKLSSGMRQTYLHYGQVYMSRLVPKLPDTGEQLSYFYQQETEKTRLYLISQRYISAETSVKLVLVSANGSTPSMREHLGQKSGFSCADVPLNPLLKAIGLSAHLVEKMPELVHMQLLASGHAVDNLAPATLIKKYQFGRVEWALKMATLAIGFFGLCIAAWFFAQGWTHKTAQVAAQQSTRIQQMRYDTVARNFPLTTVSAADLQVALMLDKIIATYPKSPVRLMQVVSSALEASAEIELDRLRWVLSPDRNIKDEDQLITLSADANPTTALASTTETATLIELGFVTAEIAGFNGDYRHALNSVNRFVAQLKADHSVDSVEILQQPVNVSSYVNLQGSTNDELTRQTQPALFKLKVILKTAITSASSVTGEQILN